MFRSPHVRLLVAKFPICFRFYRDILGLSARFGSEDGVYTEFEAGNQIIALYRREMMAEAVGTSGKPTATEAQDKAALILTTDSVDAAAERLRAKGIALVTEPQNRPEWGVRTAHFRDPDGNLIEINSAIPA